jgi:transcriptional pleiotropic regulator of transition state genes
MKATGIVRNVDELGRIVIPAETRRVFGIEPLTPIEIFTSGDSIVLKTYQNRCGLCGSLEGVEQLSKGNVCKSCVKQIKTNF